VDRIFRIHQTPRTPRTFGQLEASRSFGIAALWRRIRQLARLKAESARLWRLLAEDQDEIEGLWKDLRGVRGCRGLDSDRSAERGLGGIGSPSGEPELEKLELDRARENRSRRSGAEARQRGVNGEPEGETEKVFPARQISAVETRETRECRAFEVRPPPGECRAFQVRPSSGKTLRQSLEIFRESCEPGLEELGETELGVTTSRPRPSRPRRPNPTLPRLGLGPGLRDRIRPEANETSLEYLEELEGVEAC